MKKLLTKIYTIAILTVSSTATFAGGGPYTPYQPYNPHPPVDTGLVSGPVYALALILFVSGVVVLLNTQAIRSKLNLD